MSNLTYIKRILKHPKYVLNENFLLHPFDSLITSKQILQSNHALFDCVNMLTGDSIENIQKYYDDIQNNTSLTNHIDNKFKTYDDYITKSDFKNLKFSQENPAGRLSRLSQEHAGILLYLLVRSVRPKFFVETGVSAGESSTYILQAMHDNDFGELHSIDLPRATVEQGLTTIIPEGESSGWLIPDHLKNRWKLYLGKSEQLLPEILKKLKNIDIFFHDSLHTYEHMFFEYSTSWEFINENGILVSDDITVMNGKGHSPLVDFANSKQKKIIVYNVLGGIKK